ncbi:hypothetical protein ACFS27_22755 [Promicromonospora vindobonensis]|uniref:Uncharacterized protein n=1 Tax=Promicromonospora vindobonensis TaxID=195748 RepID=A0ABW5VYW1_9MICO
MRGTTAMLHLWTTLVVAYTAVRDRYQSMSRDEKEGGYTTETVVFTVALLLLAGIVIAAITTFVNGEVIKIVSPNG